MPSKTRLAAPAMVLVFCSASAQTARPDSGLLFHGIEQLPITMSLAETEHGDALISLAELATEETIPRQARRFYEKGLKADRKGEPAVALEWVEAAVEIAPDFFQAHAALAVGYLRLANYGAAEHELESAERLDPYYLPAQEIKGLILFFRGQFRKAAETLKEVVKSGPCRTAAHYYLARSLAALNDYDGARRYLEAARALLRKGQRPILPSASEPSPSSGSSLWPAASGASVACVSPEFHRAGE